MPDILTMLALLASLRDDQATLEATRWDALPPGMRKRVGALEAAYASRAAVLARDRAHLEAQIKAAVLAHGASVKGAALQAVYVGGKATWDDHALQGFAAVHADILAFRHVGQPSVTIRSVRPETGA
jgi:hypothetical protein